ncbi:mannose-6-phosphate isomerase-like protein (cupin superfamily) [Halarchaeum rubridurum]|uniref:Cupin n=1 Tax=Halarchaeum rubridurum TaxID=489911 RepID=A0A830G6F9_9EURY|nr:cupin [Halarchaeum rubridurum]MBP1955627.1 mannose-6-phosphate isomerase-like protein (cupin superfamily) [Halarchaeum rubridurum]GGM76518.1 cupin [Halarchaeum rubridurum]
MTYTKATAADAESVLPDSVEGEMWMMRDVLDTESLGFTVLALEAGEETMSHDHTDDDLEEVYYVAEGGVDVDFGDRTASLDAEEAIRISPDEERIIRNCDSFSKLVLVSAPV